MKKRMTISVIILLAVTTGCGGGSKQTTDNLITVDVTASYPKKELILQDFMEVEYVSLESSNEFVTMGWPHAIGKEIIIVRNRNRSSDGDIFVFDRNGKSLRKINRLGQGNEEYTFLLGITLDEDNNEIFVNDHWTRKIMVYDLFGNFKRSLSHIEGTQYGMDIYNFDKENLICHDGALNSDLMGSQNEFLIISKQDGRLIKEIEIPYKEKVSSNVSLTGGNAFMPIRNRRLVPQRNNSWTLMENSSDIIYSFQSDYSVIPLIRRTPAIESMSPGVFLYPAVFTDRYYFMQTVEAKWDWGTNTGHTRINLMYDKEENTLYECTVYNVDYPKRPILMTSEITIGDNKIAFVQKLEAHELVDAYEKGYLKGKLKDIAASLDEDSNPVIMIVKYKE